MNEPQLTLDWSAYAHYGEGDAYARLPTHGGGFGKAASVCIGSANCQRASGPGVMCPSFRVTSDLHHSTHHRAATLRAAMNGEFGAAPFAATEVQEALDLCVACKGCKRECPNGVDMAMLKTEVQSQQWTDGAASTRDRIIAALPLQVPTMQPMRALARWLMRQRRPGGLLARWMERHFGIAAHRSLPALAPRSFLEDETAGSPATAGRLAKPVLLLVDTFSNHLDPATVQKAIEVLEAVGCQVRVLRPPADEPPLCCGRTAWSTGDVSSARAHAQRLLSALEPHLAGGAPVIGLEPSCLLMLRDEYHALGLGEAAGAWAKRAWLLEEYLARDAQAAKLEWQPVDRQARVHGHCHQKAFGAMKAVRKVLGWVPTLKVDYIESSCCGMAGAFGYEAEHHAVSMQMAEAALLPAVRAAAQDDVIVANGTSCRHQILDGAQREAVHLVHLLHAALPRPAAAA